VTRSTGGTWGALGAAAAATIVLDPATRTFTGAVGESMASPVQTVTVRNGGQTDMTPTLGTLTGTAAPYLTPTLVTHPDTGLATITLTVHTVPPTGGTYSFSLPVLATGASNTPQALTGAITIAPRFARRLDTRVRLGQDVLARVLWVSSDPAVVAIVDDGHPDECLAIGRTPGQVCLTQSHNGSVVAFQTLTVLA
jgi:hypothetical protein